MGPINPKMPDLLKDELKKMKLLVQQNEYWVFEKTDQNKLYEYWVYRSEKNNFESLENFANEIKKQNFTGIAKIINTERRSNTEWFTTEYLFAVIIDHPKFTLHEFLQKKSPSLNPTQITQLLGQIVGAQKILGETSQYLGYNDIFTNDGTEWVLKPFQQTTSFYYKMKLASLNTEPEGYPAPEEYNGKEIDVQKVKVFGLGMIVLQLILNTNLKDVYQNEYLNKEKLQDKINRAKDIQGFTKVYVNTLLKMLEIDPQKRPTFPEISLLLQKQESGIHTQLRNNLSQINEIQKTDSCNGSASRQTFTGEELSQRQYIDQLEKNLHMSKKKLQDSQNISEKKINFSEIGYIEESNNQSVKQYYQNGKIKYDGGINRGKYHGYGVLYSDDYVELNTPLNYLDLRQVFKYAIKYEGNFQEEKKHGQGKLYFSNGETFAGDFENDQINGIGKFEQTNKQIITGCWKNGFYQSGKHQLTLLVQNNQIPYVMETEPFTFNNVQSREQSAAFQFEGISKLAVDDSYLIGSQPKQKQSLQQNLKEERLDLQNGFFYMGQTLNSLMHGQGKIFGLGGKILYEGQFRQGKYDGMGTLFNLNEIEVKQLGPTDLTSTQISNSWLKYEGEFVGGKKHGTGRYYFANNSQYSGEFADDEIHGSGALNILNIGFIYGEWRNGNMFKQVK